MVYNEEKTKGEVIKMDMQRTFYIRNTASGSSFVPQRKIKQNVEQIVAEELLKQYYLKFNAFPPLPFSYNYDDEPMLILMERALKTGKRITLIGSREDVTERAHLGVAI